MPTDKKKIGPYLKPVSIGLFCAIAVLFVLVHYVASVVKVEGSSMDPVLRDQERIIILKSAMHQNNFRRFDIIVFSWPGAGRTKFIKRVIGLPGEKIEIKKGRILVNEKKLFPAGPVFQPHKRQPLKPMKPVVIPPGHYFVIGDNPGISLDSRIIGLIPARRIIGKAVLRYWPLSRMGFLS